MVWVVTFLLGASGIERVMARDGARKTSHNVQDAPLRNQELRSPSWECAKGEKPHPALTTNQGQRHANFRSRTQWHRHTDIQ